MRSRDTPQHLMRQSATLPENRSTESIRSHRTSFAMHFVLLALLLATIAHPAHASEEACAAALKKMGDAALRAPVDRFDQDQTVGWRALADLGCFTAAALLIEYYALDYDSKYRALKWHLAQMHASAGNVDKALEAAQLSLSPIQEQMHPDFDWNDYVLATMAFLRGDRPAFDKHRAALRVVSPRSSMNSANESVLDSLDRCFGKGYRDAYACNSTAEGRSTK